MSRIGKLPVKIPEGVSVEVNGQVARVQGPKGVVEKEFPKGVQITVNGGKITVSIREGDESYKSLQGTTRSILQNMVRGVKDGWSKVIELVGTGYRAEVSGDTLTILIGFSHPVKFKAPEGISFSVQKTEITIEGADKEIVGQTAASIRAVRPPEPYKGKGIKYKDEYVRRKAGKAAKAVGAA
jgi:large subunit ribosomal protein L6